MEARVEDSDSFQRALGEVLIAAGKLDKSGLERAARLANGRDERLANVLAKLVKISPGHVWRENNGPTIKKFAGDRIGEIFAASDCGRQLGGW